jgi:hypothetical protein
MPCENYREALTEAAATDSAPSRDLRSHLDVCASCRAAFTEDLQLFSAIDSGLRVTANAVAPASLLPRVRAQLTERPASRRTWFPVIASVGVAVALVVAFVLVRKSARDGVEPNPQAISAAHIVPPDVNQLAAPAIARLEAARTARKPSRVAAVQTVPAGHAASEEPEVLIPAGQKQAIDALLASVRRGQVDAEVFLTEKSEKPLQELRVSPLDIAPIELKPLSSTSAEPASTNEGTGR